MFREDVRREKVEGIGGEQQKGVDEVDVQISCRGKGEDVGVEKGYEGG